MKKIQNQFNLTHADGLWRLWMTLLHMLWFNLAFAQDIRVFHGRNGETAVFTSANVSVIKHELKKKKGEKFTIRVMNANPLFYSYEVKYEELEDKSENQEINDLLVVFNTILSSRMSAGSVEATFDAYKKALDTVQKEIDRVKLIMLQSDIPEEQEDALRSRRTGGLRRAIDFVANMPSTSFHFNSPTLLQDLNTTSNQIDDLDPVFKRSLGLLNESLVNKVNDLKKKITDRNLKTYFDSEFSVGDKKTKAYLIIKRIDASNNSLVRDYHENDQKLELATITPYFERSTLELVPVGNFLFANNVKELYLENSIIQSRERSKIQFTPGVVLNINITRFGETKEMALGLGAGYKLSSNSDAFENFFISSLLSYKNIFRIGLGLGFSQFPSGSLKNGITIGQMLPADIANLGDLLEYEEKPTVFLTIAFAGLNLTKKK